jgi:cell pole-organizing protein PopZ
MQFSVDEEERSMDEALAIVRRVFAEEAPSETKAGHAVPPPSDKDTAPKVTPDAGLLSREASAAVSSAVNRLTENVKRHQPTLEDVFRDALRPVLKSWLEENLPGVVERVVQAEIERAIRGR